MNPTTFFFHFFYQIFSDFFFLEKAGNFLGKNRKSSRCKLDFFSLFKNHPLQIQYFEK